MQKVRQIYSSQDHGKEPKSQGDLLSRDSKREGGTKTLVCIFPQHILTLHRTPSTLSAAMFLSNVATVPPEGNTQILLEITPALLWCSWWDYSPSSFPIPLLLVFLKPVPISLYTPTSKLFVDITDDCHFAKLHSQALGRVFPASCVASHSLCPISLQWHQASDITAASAVSPWSLNTSRAHFLGFFAL